MASSVATGNDIRKMPGTACKDDTGPLTNQTLRFDVVGQATNNG